MVVNQPIFKYDGDPFDESFFYRTIVGALQYATIT
jgi:hypothetical protein